jgi:hypothetical protein
VSRGEGGRKSYPKSQNEEFENGYLPTRLATNNFQYPSKPPVQEPQKMNESRKKGFRVEWWVHL